jgi:hypothetical protein
MERLKYNLARTEANCQLSSMMDGAVPNFRSRAIQTRRGTALDCQDATPPCRTCRVRLMIVVCVIGGVESFRGR